MSEDLMRTPEVMPTTAVEAITRGEIDMQIATAKKYPRNVPNAIADAVKLVSRDQETAESCFYVLERKEKDGGKKRIEGPSIRLAEIVLHCWGNAGVGARIVDNDGRFLTAQGVGMDLEKNTRVFTEVKRRITGRDGRAYSDDMIGVTAGAACSIAFRNAVFDLIPQSIVKPIYDAARKTAVGDVKTLPARRERMIGVFALMGVSKERVLARIGKETIEQAELADVELLVGVAQAIREGETTPEAEFPDPTARPQAIVAGGTGPNPDPAPPGRSAELAARLKGAKATREKTAADGAQPEGEPPAEPAKDKGLAAEELAALDARDAKETGGQKGLPLDRQRQPGEDG